MSTDLERAIIGVRPGHELFQGQVVYATCAAIPIPDLPENMDPNDLAKLINTVDTPHNSRLIVTDDFVVYLVDESMTRVIKSAVTKYAPPDVASVTDFITQLVDDADHVQEWHRDVISNAKTFRYDFETRGMFGAKTLPVYYHMVQDISGFWYIFLQSSYDGDATGSMFATALGGLLR